MQEVEKVFIGKVETKTFDNGGEITKIGLGPQDKEKLMELFAASESGWINFNMKESKDGERKYIELDTWKPNKESDF